MSVLKCPANCDHDEYLFLHTLITHEKVIDGYLCRLTMVICNECRHWTDAKVGCVHYCHETRGLIVDRIDVFAVDLSQVNKQPKP